VGRGRLVSFFFFIIFLTFSDKVSLIIYGN
jgi:hypothetical protein